jgi:hypothetical protein
LHAIKITSTIRSSIVDALAAQYKFSAEEALAAKPSNENKCCQVSDITAYYTTSTRSQNDASNAIRERILTVISDPPPAYLTHPEHGNAWSNLHREWTVALKKVAEETNIPAYTRNQVTVRGGRGFNYDADVEYYNDTVSVANRKIEFKYGCPTIDKLPQFLSLSAKVELFPETYDKFWYENYLPLYIACDQAITEPIPAREDYLKHVTSTNYSVMPFIEQVKQREMEFQKEKNDVVNQSITAYLTKYGPEINLKAFAEKVKATQSDKTYLLWCNEKFSLDKLTDAELSGEGMTFHSIKNGNVLELKTGNTVYGLLLRWRNHKGILNPAWQISMKRL